MNEMNEMNKNNKSWWQQDWTEEIVVFSLLAICLSIVWQWDLSVKPVVTPGSNVVSGITGGLVGYLTRGLSKTKDPLK